MDELLILGTYEFYCSDCQQIHCGDYHSFEELESARQAAQDGKIVCEYCGGHLAK